MGKKPAKTDVPRQKATPMYAFNSPESMIAYAFAQERVADLEEFSDSRQHTVRTPEVRAAIKSPKREQPEPWFAAMSKAKNSLRRFIAKDDGGHADVAHPQVHLAYLALAMVMQRFANVSTTTKVNDERNAEAREYFEKAYYTAPDEEITQTMYGTFLFSEAHRKLGIGDAAGAEDDLLTLYDVKHGELECAHLTLWGETQWALASLHQADDEYSNAQHCMYLAQAFYGRALELDPGNAEIVDIMETLEIYTDRTYNPDVWERVRPYIDESILQRDRGATAVASPSPEQ